MEPSWTPPLHPATSLNQKMAAHFSTPGESKWMSVGTRKKEKICSRRVCLLPLRPDLRASNCLESLYQLSSAGDLGVPSMAVDAPPATAPCPSQSPAWAHPGPPRPPSVLLSRSVPKQFELLLLKYTFPETSLSPLPLAIDHPLPSAVLWTPSVN
jgi:hypothetical protein